MDHCYRACTGCQSSSGSVSNSRNFVIWWPLFNSQDTFLIWSAHTVSLVRCGRPHRSFCQFCRTTWTLLLVVSLLLLQDCGTLFLWTVELLHLLTHLRPGLRHFSLFRHNPHCSTCLFTMARYTCIDWLIDWSGRISLSPIDWRCRPYNSVCTNVLPCDVHVCMGTVARRVRVG